MSISTTYLPAGSMGVPSFGLATQIVQFEPGRVPGVPLTDPVPVGAPGTRSEEHTSELQSQSNLVCRLLLEKKTMETCDETDISLLSLCFYSTLTTVVG